MKITIKFNNGSDGVVIETATRYFMRLIINSCFPDLGYDPALILQATNDLTIGAMVVTDKGDEISLNINKL